MATNRQTVSHLAFSSHKKTVFSRCHQNLKYVVCVACVHIVNMLQYLLNACMDLRGVFKKKTVILNCQHLLSDVHAMLFLLKILEKSSLTYVSCITHL